MAFARAKAKQFALAFLALTLRSLPLFPTKEKAPTSSEIGAFGIKAWQ